MKNSYAAIIPTYDRPDHLYNAIQSVKSQTLKPKEIIVVDNHPNSKNLNLVKNISKKLKIKINYLKYTGEGKALAARNYASKKTNCKYIAFLDDDDEWKKSYAKEAINEIRKNKSKVCITEYNVINENRKKIFRFNIPKILKIKDLYIWNPGVLCSNIIFETRVFNNLNGYDSSILGSADKEILIRCIKNNIKYIVLQKPLVNWLRHKNQWSNNSKLILKGVVRFHKKYLPNMDLITKVRHYKKIIYYFFLSRIY